MKKLAMLSVFLLYGVCSSQVSAQCFGPACFPAQPNEVCFPEGCVNVVYEVSAPLGDNNLFVKAYAFIPGTEVETTCAGPDPAACFDRFSTMGWSGPCKDSVNNCPDIYNQAYADLVTNMKRANRAIKFTGFFNQ